MRGRENTERGRGGAHGESIPDQGRGWKTLKNEKPLSRGQSANGVAKMWKRPRKILLLIGHGVFFSFFTFTLFRMVRRGACFSCIFFLCIFCTFRGP